MNLDIFVEASCEICATATTIAKEVARRFPGVRVALIDLAEAAEDVPESVFAVPTYLLDGRVVSLGNPRLDDLAALIEAKASSGRVGELINPSATPVRSDLIIK